jgi:hypothetical protein
MTTAKRISSNATMRPLAVGSRDQDLRKGAIEDGRAITTANAPGLDDQGLPNDEITIAQVALGARADGTQG